MSSRSVWTVALVCVTTFMLVLDITVVAVALPQMGQELHASLGELQWVVDGYTLALAALILGAATVGDRIGRVPLFATGTVVFTVGSLACGLAPTALALDLFRALQGIGGAVLFGIGVPMIADAYPVGRSRNLAIGAYGAVSGGAVAIGPLLGGVLTAVVDWRSIFWVNVPVGAVVLLLCRNRLAQQSTFSTQRLDWCGSVSVTAALFLLVFALIRGGTEGWTSPLIISSTAGAVALLIAFVVVERRFAHPMVDFALFRAPVYTAGVIVGFVLQATLVASTIYLSLYAQNVLGLSALETGLRFLPFSLVAFATAAAVAPLHRLVSPRLLLSGTALCTAAGLALLALMRESSDWTVLIPGFVVGGMGLGAAGTILNQVSVASVGPERAGMASGVSVVFRQVGVAAGVAGLGVIYQGVITARVRDGLAGSPLVRPGTAHDIVAAVAAVGGTRVAEGLPDSIRGTIEHVAGAATVAGLTTVVVLGAAVALFAAVVSWFLTGSSPGGGVDRSPDPSARDGSPH